PIAKIAALLAVGYTLDEISNDITQVTPASFEPTIDYVVTKVPRFTFEKFPGSKDTLGSQMKSVGETMSIGRTFKESFQKAFRSLETDRSGYGSDGNLREMTQLSDLEKQGDNVVIDYFEKILKRPNPERMIHVKNAMMFGSEKDRNRFTVKEMHDITGIDPWFLDQIQDLIDFERLFAAEAQTGLNPTLLREAKERGFSDRQLAFILERHELESVVRDESRPLHERRAAVINALSAKEAEISQSRNQAGILPVYHRVDTCAGEFEAHTPYLYSTYEELDESGVNRTKKVIILGGGPNRIGQGIEFDYCCCHASFALKAMGIESIMVNSNPETVSTDYDTSDKLYFEPLTLEDVLHICKNEKPQGVILQFGGQTPLKLARGLEKAGVRILGTSPDSIDRAEDRDRFSAMLTKLGLRQPDNGSAFTIDEALSVAQKIGYPCLVRPSYVLGGRGMAIVHNNDQLHAFMKKAEEINPEHPILVDRFLEDAIEIDVDALCDGTSVFVAGIMQHIEEAGV
ncbi:MAG: carbamoyl-phosphate synthase large subunit, partial [Spirochaetia bacterium]|nr:carbamoyl-phosphate synthase large subunit [Spirochaetia bacterium]